MLSNVKEDIRELEALKNYNLVEFHHQLRNLIARSYERDIITLIEILDSFYTEIIRNGIFYIDVLNTTLYFFFNQNLKNTEGVVSMFRVIEPICDTASIRTLHGIIKKLANRKQKELEEIAIKIKQSVEKRISEIEKKIDQFSLSPPKGIINQWF